ncbi:MAG: hypothetical protein H7837_10370 [Magnetococcus sp. MYC-9]
MKQRTGWRWIPLLWLAMQAEAAEFYGCVTDAGEHHSFPREACTLLTDPTQTLPAAPVRTAPARVRPLPEDKPATPVAGPWTVTQLLFPDPEQRARGWQNQAVINGRPVAVGALVEGGRLRQIGRHSVIIAHEGGETEVPFGRETTASGFVRPATVTISLEELGLQTSHLQLMQRLAAGKELLIQHNGQPVARLLPVEGSE